MLQAFGEGIGQIKGSLTSAFFCPDVAGYDGIPVEAMQGIDINSSHPGSTYGHIGGGEGAEEDHVGKHNLHNNLQSNNEQLDFGNGGPDVPQPPNDNNQVAAWYDTDL